MEHIFSTYNVEIKNLKYITEDGRKFPRTAIITFVSAEGHEESISQLGYPGEQEIWDIIRRGDPLNLDNCYIDHLSLPDYREKQKLELKEYVQIREFSARSAFFNSKFPIDLEYAEFSGEGVSFEVRQGEILGIAGLVGSRRTEVVRTICGIDHKDNGNVKLNGKHVPIRSYKHSIQNGIVYWT